jgi:hypothetical protein
MGRHGCRQPNRSTSSYVKLTNAEFHLAGEEKPLSGGREFFESLTAAVSLYAQELLSGIRTFKSPQTTSQLVQLQRLDNNHHRLSVLPPDADPGSGITTHLTRQVDLTTVQLFDLVEAIDQFFADSQTLPDLTFRLRPSPSATSVAANLLPNKPYRLRSVRLV